jgi:hypothetical protein
MIATLATYILRTLLHKALAQFFHTRQQPGLHKAEFPFESTAGKCRFLLLWLGFMGEHNIPSFDLPGSFTQTLLPTDLHLPK